MEEIVKHINDTNASYRTVGAGDAKNTDLFLDNEHYELFKDAGEQITVRFNRENLTKAILFIASILPRKYDNSSIHKNINFSTAFVFDQLAFLDGFFTVDGVKVESRTQIWNARKDVLKANGEIDKRFYFNGLLEDIEYTNYKGERKSAKFTIRNYIAGGYSDLHIKKASNGIFDIWVTNTFEPYNDGREKGLEIMDTAITNPLQQIFYGAPGTGKSHEISKQTDGEAVVRTTFHPDSDYSTFVGAYKPVMKDVDVPVVPVVVNSGIGLEPGGTYKEKRITYQFVKQAFLKAYLGAWKKYADRCSICCVPAVQEFETGNGRYVINSVGIYDLTLSREFQFPKSLVLKEWPNLWNNGVFELPKGPQTGKSVQHAIANWIFDNIDNCTEEKFDEGWQKLINTFRDKGHVDVQKTQTYIISDVAEDNETLTINVEARGKKKATLKRKFYELDEIKPSKLEKTLVDILKGYSSDFEDAWELLKQNVNEGVTPEVKDESNGQIDSQFLVIEEINRGNCAQIFGDIFQLLDRSDNGFSVYPIEADSDLRDAIKEAFTEDGDYKLSTDIDIEGVIEYTSNYGATLSEDIQSGRVLLLPPNFYIWATMNTSDQSLFPIDSAFKRRWDWKYIKIKDEHKDWKVDVELKSKDDNVNEATKKVDWWEFVEKINKIIASMTSSADKQLGYFFCKATEIEDGKTEPTIITKDTFVSKVIFYLWNDVFKDYGFEDASLFRYKEVNPATNKEEEKDLTFPDFYDEAGEEVNTVRLTDFVEKVLNWRQTKEELK